MKKTHKNKGQSIVGIDVSLVYERNQNKGVNTLCDFAPLFLIKSLKNKNKITT